MHQTIKKLKTQTKNNYTKYKLNGEYYRAYKISDLPNKYGTDKLTDWYTINTIGHGHGGLVLISESSFESWN